VAPHHAGEEADPALLHRLRAGARAGAAPYDAYSYAQNFDDGEAWVEPNNLSRSFSVRFVLLLLPLASAATAAKVTATAPHLSMPADVPRAILCPGSRRRISILPRTPYLLAAAVDLLACRVPAGDTFTTNFAAR